MKRQKSDTADSIFGKKWSGARRTCRTGDDGLASKCQVVLVTGSKSPYKSEYILHGQVLETVTCARYLGVDISSNISWSSHIGCVVGNANRSLGYIRCNIKSKSKDVRESAYNTIVRPQLEYASAVWDPHTKEHISKIEKSSEGLLAGLLVTLTTGLL